MARRVWRASGGLLVAVAACLPLLLWPQAACAAVDADRLPAAVEPGLARVVVTVSGELEWRGKSYPVAVTRAATGFFVTPSGDLLTTAWVGELAADEASRTAALRAGVVQPILEDLGLPATAQTAEQLRSAFASDEPRLSSPPRAVGEVVLANRERHSFEVKAVAGELALFRVDVTGAASLSFAAADAVPGTAVLVVGYAAEEAVARRATLGAAPGGAPPGTLGLAANGAALPAGAPVLDDAGAVLGVAISSGSDRAGLLASRGDALQILRQAGIEPRPAATAGALSGRGGFWLVVVGTGVVLSGAVGLVGCVLVLRHQRRVSGKSSRTAPRRAVPAVASAPQWGGDAGGTVVFDPGVSGRLLAVVGPVEGAFNIGPGLSIGRIAGKVSLVVPEQHVSSTHAWVGPAGGRIVLRDIGSTNGTFLNDDMSQRISEAELRHGDVIVLGNAGTVKFRYMAR